MPIRTPEHQRDHEREQLVDELAELIAQSHDPGAVVDPRRAAVSVAAYLERLEAVTTQPPPTVASRADLREQLRHEVAIAAAGADPAADTVALAVDTVLAFLGRWAKVPVTEVAEHARTSGARIELVTVPAEPARRVVGAERPEAPAHHYGRVFAANGEETWRTSETYADPADVERAVESLVDTLDVIDVGGVRALTAVEVTP